MTKEERMEADRKRSREIRAKFPEQIKKKLREYYHSEKGKQWHKKYAKAGKKSKVDRNYFQTHRIEDSVRHKRY